MRRQEIREAVGVISAIGGSLVIVFGLIIVLVRTLKD
jgi:hypothetical protein